MSTQNPIEQRASKGYIRYLDEEVLRIGDVVFTRRKLRSMGLPTTQSVGILNYALKRFKTGSIEEVAKSVDLFMLKGAGVGERTMIMWLEMLRKNHIDAIAWLDSDLSLSTLCSKKRKSPPRRRYVPR